MNLHCITLRLSLGWGVEDIHGHLYGHICNQYSLRKNSDMRGTHGELVLATSSSRGSIWVHLVEILSEREKPAWLFYEATITLFQNFVRTLQKIPDYFTHCHHCSPSWKSLVTQSCPTICESMLLCPWNSPGKNTGVDCHSLLQGIFQTQGSNLDLPHCRQILYHLSHR